MHSSSVAKEKNTSALLELQVELNFFHGALFLLDITTDKLQTMINQTSVFDRHFLKKRGACHLKNK